MSDDMKWLIGMTTQAVIMALTTVLTIVFNRLEIFACGFALVVIIYMLTPHADIWDDESEVRDGES